MKKPLFAVVIAVLAVSLPAAATQFTINVTLDAAQAGVVSPGTGSATLLLDDVAMTLDVNLSYQDLTSPTSTAHIHCCSPPGVSSGVIIPFVPPFVTGLTSGTFVNTFALTPTLLSQVESGGAYINIHTTNFPAGEIRGQISAVPEPGTAMLTVLGLSGLALRRRNSV